ncbi:branched-chain amino acid ABC transporter permease [Natronomonas sp. F2-12]|jgi:branched-chain amino acid transport system permease protein|uniref:Branched-chain amino acid ABC transporter permease n=1 Tax=Natronomonas aquatica TaxID=2841590 RepID=A0A9R1CNN5_9EURY|nr:branched-chain amino acid ABC transporter permease [Natronomonas aquatica]MCQ4332033.1 branched-chain amino acid ABC transporter permease [Natronomonas aquatica]
MSYAFRDRLATADNTTWLAVAVAALLLAAPFFLGGFQTSLLTRTLIFALFAVAFNLLYGYTGLLSFGHAMFVSVAGYTTAKTATVIAPALGFGELFGGIAPVVTWILILALSVVVATIVAVTIGYLSVQLEEIYFALITLAFSMAIFVVFLQDTIGELLHSFGLGDGTWSNGSDGLTFRMGEVQLFGSEFRLVSLVDPFHYYFLALFIVTLGLYALWRIVRSPFGMICQAIRENPDRARALGINVTYHQWMTFIISGMFSGLAGGLLVSLSGQVNPEAHAHWSFSAVPVLMTVIGGPYSFLGPVFGAFAHEYLRWIIRQFPLLEEYWQFSFGVLLLIVVLFLDNGVAGGINRFRAWLGVASTRYADDGAGGVVAFTRETVTHYLSLAGEKLAR